MRDVCEAAFTLCVSGRSAFKRGGEFILEQSLDCCYGRWAVAIDSSFPPLTRTSKRHLRLSLGGVNVCVYVVRLLLPSRQRGEWECCMKKKMSDWMCLDNFFKNIGDCVDKLFSSVIQQVLQNIDHGCGGLPRLGQPGGQVEDVSLLWSGTCCCLLLGHQGRYGSGYDAVLMIKMKPFI